MITPVTAIHTGPAGGLTKITHYVVFAKNPLSATFQLNVLLIFIMIKLIHSNHD
jgi:hypothetical protein